ncbi:MAG: Fumarate and nitrate reduction regulatory protein [Gammaproteobacteria bacterium]|nr:Fumarate and nitrate reduction regulatory protein [Gammaproteobacteria bacterium]
MQTQESNVVRFGQAALRCADCRLQRLCIMNTVASHCVGETGIKCGRPSPRGHHLFRQGERLQALYIVRSGSAKSYVSTPDGLEQVIRFHLPGDLIGVDALGEGTHTSSTQAMEMITVCRFPLDVIDDAAHHDPALYAQILKHAGREITKEHARAVLLAQRGADERLAAFLLQMSEAYAHLGYSAVAFNLPMARQDIASYLALAVETVSRLFTNFQHEGLLEVDRRSIRIPSLERLRAVARASGKPLLTANG